MRIISFFRKAIIVSAIAALAVTYQLPITANVERAAGPAEALLSDFEPLPNFDVRQLRRGRAPQGDAERKKLSLASDRDALDKVTLRWDDQLDLPRYIFASEGALTRGSRDDAEVIAKDFVRANTGLFNISRNELDAARVAARETDSRASFTRLALEQRVGGIRVFDTEMLFIIDGDGRVVSQSGSFIPGLERRLIDSAPRLSAEEALRSAARFCGGELRAAVESVVDRLPSRDRVVFSSEELDGRSESSLVYYPITRDEVRLAYQVLLYGVPTMLDAYLILIDAGTGELLRRDSLTYAADAPMGRVFTKENPGIAVERELVMLQGDATASPEGWVTSNRTAGNNVEAFVNADLTGGSTVKANDDGGFDFALDLAQGRSPLDSAKASATNLFYWVNLIHDRFHALGFTESSRNFQINNFNRGGRDSDPVRAETLRGAAINPSTTNQLVRNNAFFQTAPDGSRPMLAMLLWVISAGGQTLELDSSYDAGVIIHEYTHGVSTRLAGTDNSTGLRSLQGGGMGEGWSDFFAQSFLNGGEPLDGAYPSGVYLTRRERGIRVYPYSTDSNKNPLTFGDIQYNSEVHAQGTVWATMLWEMRQALIERYGFEVGRDTAELLVVNGLKGTPFAPSFVDARDAILVADQVTNGGANQELIWRVFARRGLGFSARTTLVTPSLGFRISATEGYDLPPWVTAGSLVINDRAPAPAVLFETLPVVVTDKDLTTAQPVSVTVRNITTRTSASFELQATTPGRFAAALRVLPPEADGGPGARIVARPGDELVISYANAKNQSGAAETVEARTTVGRRVSLYSYDFEQGEQAWIITNAWHLTERRFSSATHSLYFAKRKGENDSRSFTKAASTGNAFSPQINLNELIKPRLEFDYYFIGALAGDASSPAGDILTLGARNTPYTTAGATIGGEPPLSATFDVRPQSDSIFHSATVDLRFIGKQRAYFNFAFSASRANIARKHLEGFYLDNIRVTAISTK